MTRNTEHRYRVAIAWTGDLGSGTSGYAAYGRDHEVRIDGKPAIAASSDPQFRGDAARHNPEELFVAALSSCHMLWYLHLCADAGIVVTRYEDAAEGTMVIAAHGGGQFREIVLRPRVAVASGDAGQAGALHERAHALCFIANSVSCAVRIEPVIEQA